MTTTCVLGHAWNEGAVLCPTCGFGRRVGAAAAIPTQAAAPITEQVAVSVGVGAGYADGYAGGAAQSAYSEPQATADLVLSPDGQWAWDGMSWIPATMLTPQPEPQPAAEPVPTPDLTPTPVRSRRIGRATTGRVKTRAARAPKDAQESNAVKEPGAHRVDPKLLLGGVLAVAAMVGADLLLHLPPLGHATTAAAAAPIVKGHPRGPVRTGAQPDAATLRSDLRNAATVEKTFLTANGVYSTNPVQLTKDGFRHTGTDRILVAAAGAAGYCLVDTQVGATPTTWYAYDSQRGGLQPRTFATEAAAVGSCAPGLGSMHLLSAG